MMKWIYLGIAITAEVTATSFLKSSEGFTRLWPSVAVAVGYGVAFYFLALTLKTMPVGIAYAVWAGTGIALIALVGWVFFGQILDVAAVIGISLIAAGVLVLNVFSNSVSH